MAKQTIAIWLWDKVLGYLSWDERKSLSTFVYDEAFLHTGWDVAPLGWSIHSPSALLPKYGNRDKLYAGLPPFVADSLPDRWGNRVFEAWAKRNGLTTKEITPIDRLSFIGKRGMGALEFQPAQVLTGEEMPIPMAELYNLALTIQDERQDIHIEDVSNILMEYLYRVGTSAGGRRAKAIIAMNGQGNIRSGQAMLSADFTYYILKFNDNKDFPFPEVEYAYYKMAQAAGVAMMPSRLITINEKSHFLTERFDRHNGEKLHVLTLAAMDPDATSYDDMFVVCRRLNLPERQQKELFRRMVFNILGCNVDDHSKNFSFMMDKSGEWRLAPAYDILFSIDVNGPRFLNRHELSIGGKTHGITDEDLLQFARDNDIANAKTIIREVKAVLSEWRSFAIETGVPEQWIKKIEEELHYNIS